MHDQRNITIGLGTGRQYFVTIPLTTPLFLLMYRKENNGNKREILNVFRFSRCDLLKSSHQINGVTQRSYRDYAISLHL
jgi:hypothetical protein